ncbi:zinc finger CCHC domain-containing protein 3-like, partial [Oncorhynchus kisutch]|uniref:zinc finger CCHC domain-containing protein 3-like n=1 Tax=Oncorhynchus kisutch TaxID=8019 RepID=UPI0012DCD657
MEPEGEAEKGGGVKGWGDEEVSRARVEELRGMVRALVEKEWDKGKERASAMGVVAHRVPEPNTPPSKRAKKVVRRRGGKKGGEEQGDGEVAGPSWAPSPSSFKPLAELDLPGMARNWMMEGEPDFLFGDVTSPVRSPEEGGAMDLSVGLVPGTVAVFRGGGMVGDGGDVGDSRVEVGSKLVGIEKGSTGRCMAYGHTLASCSTKKCRFCGSEEHEAKECDEPKACHGCGSKAHLWRNSLEGVFDVAFYTESKHDEVLKKVKEVGATGPMGHYEVKSLAKNNFRMVTVNIYNPYVKDEEVRAFLGRYMDGVSSGRHLTDSLGFWTGRRGFQALLREDPKGLGGYLHPPAMFSLGADRGTLYYARQPPFCRRCMAYGHILASCSTRKCRFCGSGEHEAKDCDEPKACHGRCRFCGSEEHEARDCAEPKKCHGCGSVAHLWRDCPLGEGHTRLQLGGSESGGWRRKEHEEAATKVEGRNRRRRREEKKKKELGRKEMCKGWKKRWLRQKERGSGLKERWSGWKGGGRK